MTIRDKALEKTRAMLEKDPLSLVSRKQSEAINAIVDRALQQQKANLSV
jgi:hypothetical protein